MEDNFFSLIHSNDLIKEKIDDDNYLFYIDEIKNKTLLYSLEKRKIYINRRDYVGQPHIIPGWKHTDNDEYIGLCLTMDKDHRDHILNSTDMLERSKEIFFEKWPDKIYERFKEVNITLDAKRWSKFILKDESLFERDTNNNRLLNRPLNIINLEFSGEDYEEIVELIKPNLSGKYNLLNLTYNNQKKSFIVESLGGNYYFRICDNHTHSVMFGRTSESDLSEYNFTIVGAGSVGSEVIDNLIKMGAKNIKIYDEKNFGSHNTPRHFLGAQYIKENENKALAIKEFYAARYPFIEIEAFSENFDFNKPGNATHIFNTTGGTNLNRANNIFSSVKANKEIKIIDIFVEPYAAGTHMIISNLDNVLECYGIDWKKRCIVNQEIDLRNDFEGCFVPTLPYGYTPLRVSVPQLVRRSIKNNFELGHYSSYAVDLSEIDKKLINKDMEKKINFEMVGVLKW